MLKYIDKARGRLIGFILKYHLGKSYFSSKIIFWFLSLFDNLNVYTNTKEKGHRHHFVPKFILKQFKIENSEIWRYSKKTKNIKKISINDACAIEDYYLVKDIFGDQSDYIEKKLYAGTLEKFGSRIIYRLLEYKEDFDLTHLEESVLSVFLAHQITRVPEFRIQVKRLLLYLFEKKDLDKNKLGNLEFIKDYIIKNKFNISYIDLEKYNPTINFDGGINHLQIISSLLADQMAEQIYKSKSLHLLDAPYDGNFVISDNPVVVVNLEDGKYINTGCWLDIIDPNILIFLPISKNRSIFYSHRKRGISRIDNNIDMVKLVNHAQFKNAGEFIHSHSEDLLKKYIEYFI